MFMKLKNKEMKNKEVTMSNPFKDINLTDPLTSLVSTLDHDDLKASFRKGWFYVLHQRILVYLYEDKEPAMAYLEDMQAVSYGQGYGHSSGASFPIGVLGSVALFKPDALKTAGLSLRWKARKPVVPKKDAACSLCQKPWLVSDLVGDEFCFYKGKHTHKSCKLSDVWKVFLDVIKGRRVRYFITKLELGSCGVETSYLWGGNELVLDSTLPKDPAYEIAVKVDDAFIDVFRMHVGNHGARIVWTWPPQEDQRRATVDAFYETIGDVLRPALDFVEASFPNASVSRSS